MYSCYLFSGKYLSKPADYLYICTHGERLPYLSEYCAVQLSRPVISSRMLFCCKLYILINICVIFLTILLNLENIYIEIPKSIVKELFSNVKLWIVAYLQWPLFGINYFIFHKKERKEGSSALYHSDVTMKKMIPEKKIQKQIISYQVQLCVYKQGQCKLI